MPAKILRGIFWLAAVFLCVVPKMQAGCAYLKAVGVPPLRFAEADTNFFVFDPNFFDLKTNSFAVVSNSPATTPDLAAKVQTNAPNDIVAANKNSSSQPPAQTSSDEAKKISLLPGDLISSPSSASDLLTVTPEMVTELLKPGQNSGVNPRDQPGVVVFVPAEMRFTPPAPQNQGSQALYHSQ